MAISQAKTLELPSREASEYLEKKRAAGGPFTKLLERFESEGFSFFLERAKVYFFLSSGGRDVTPALIGILPSYVDVQQADQSHTAVGVAVLSDGSSVATKVVVEHNPFRVAKFSLIGFDNGDDPVTQTLDVRELADLSVANLRPLAKTSLPTGQSNLRLSRGSLHAIIAQSYKDILSDDFARPLYPEAGFSALLGQTPLVAKWAILNAGGTNAAQGIKTCGCSCTCCNGCTTTSCEIEF